MTRTFGYIAVLVLSLSAAFSTYAVNGRYLIEAESFQFKGKWFVERSSSCLGNAMLRLGGGGSLDSQYDALTIVNMAAGKYSVWVCSADYKNLQGTRLFRLSVNEKPLEDAGKHGREGFWWEKVGVVSLEGGETLLRLHDLKKNYGRCDAIYFTSDMSENPNGMDRNALAGDRKSPVEVLAEGGAQASVPAPLNVGYDCRALASVGNDEMRLAFVEVSPGVIACRTEINVNGIWRRYFSNMEDHQVYLLSSGENSIGFDKFYPSWSDVRTSRSFIFRGRQYNVRADEDSMNPFMAGELSAAIPVSAEKKGERSIEVRYVTKDNSSVTGLWTLPEKGCHIVVELSCTPASTGMYSIALAAFQPVPESAMSNVLMPPMFQFRRVDKSPVMLVSSMMQQPLAIVESTVAMGGTMSSFVSGNDCTFPEEWGSADYSPVGFALRNSHGGLQPVAFSPVMGMPDSRATAGKTFKRTFVIGACPDSWNRALEYISSDIYKVRDYRRQNDVSLTETMFNIVELMDNTEYGGWDDSLKGFYDIEGDPGTAPTVVHSAPLAIIGASVLAGDEDFYLTRALPTIEYTLSRSGYRWANDLVPSGYNRTLETLELNPFKSQFTTSYYEGLDLLTGKLNPWLEKLALPGGEPRAPKGYSVPVVSWVQSLSAYRMTGDRKWLDRTISTADRYVDIHIYNKQDKPAGTMSFYNSNVYPAWWNLIDLYEITGNRKYLDAAEYGAGSTIAGIRSYPAVRDTLMTIHPGGRFDGNTTLWWKGKERFRLGFPRKEGDAEEKKVEDWLVSPVGLGFEQPATYFLRQEGKQVRPVFMSNWAPHLLRLYQYTGNDIYQIYARNAVIGRFANYPGYYATGFTDITMSAEFPYRGPDVSSIYYHHIPPHLAFVQDFLISEIIQRSGGHVDFPYAFQEGFVWFANRIYGGGKGTVFSDRNVSLWMRRGLVSIDCPSINYVTAISGKYFWILMANESGEEKEFTIGLDDISTMLGDGNALVYTEKGKPSRISMDGGHIRLSVPGKGFRAVCVPVHRQEEMQLPALHDGMSVIDTGTPFGKLFVFRIRSPFGWDSIYCFAETSPKDDRNLSMTVGCGDRSFTASAYPFEGSFIRIGTDEKAVVRIVLKEGDRDIYTGELTMNTR